jgi:ribonuclease P protein component
MHVPGSLRFGRDKRLRWSAEFARIKVEGKRLAKGCLIGNWIEQPGRAGEPLRLGVVTPKSVGPAVDRTRARRLLRECFRLNQQKLKQPLTLVLIARPSIVGKGLAAVERDYLNLVRQAGLLAPTPAPEK